MSKQHIPAIEYMRGISMLGVIGIHTGAYSLSNPQVDIHLFAILEIFTRFSVPIFFFISAFGLFLNQNLNKKLDYTAFMTRRCRTVLIPYLVWSVLYMLHYTITSGDTYLWSPTVLLEYFLFGLASYQLYFLVILLWFYSLMPLWRIMLRHITANPLKNLGALLLLQIAFNYYSSYLLTPSFANTYLNIAVQYRLSYWVLHYIFIFLLGAICALRYHDLTKLFSRYGHYITAFFFFTLTGMLSFYYYLLYVKGYSPETAVNIDHQLSPIGVLYTIAATLYWFKLFNSADMPSYLSTSLAELGKHSYIIYLFHPFAMYYLINYFAGFRLVMTVPVTLSFYLLTVIISLYAGVLVKKLSKPLPIISFLLTGSSMAKKPVNS